MWQLIRESERQNYNALNIFTFSSEQPAANLDICAMRKYDASEFHSGVVTAVISQVWISKATVGMPRTYSPAVERLGLACIH